MHVIPYASSREIFHMFYNNPGLGLLSYTPVTEPKYIPSYDENEVPEKLFYHGIDDIGSIEFYLFLL